MKWGIHLATYRGGNVLAHGLIKANQAFVGTTETERDAMFDTGAFNEICKSYFIKAMKNCELSEDVISSVMDEFKWLLDTVSSTEIKNAIEKKLAN